MALVRAPTHTPTLLASASLRIWQALQFCICLGRGESGTTAARSSGFSGIQRALVLREFVEYEAESNEPNEEREEETRTNLSNVRMRMRILLATSAANLVRPSVSPADLLRLQSVAVAEAVASLFVVDAAKVVEEHKELDKLDADLFADFDVSSHEVKALETLWKTVWPMCSDLDSGAAEHEGVLSERRMLKARYLHALSTPGTLNAPTYIHVADSNMLDWVPVDPRSLFTYMNESLPQFINANASPSSDSKASDINLNQKQHCLWSVKFSLVETWLDFMPIMDSAKFSVELDVDSRVVSLHPSDMPIFLGFATLTSHQHSLLTFTSNTLANLTHLNISKIHHTTIQIPPSLPSLLLLHLSHSTSPAYSLFDKPLYASEPASSASLLVPSRFFPLQLFPTGNETDECVVFGSDMYLETVYRELGVYTPAAYWDWVKMCVGRVVSLRKVLDVRSLEDQVDAVDAFDAEEEKRKESAKEEVERVFVDWLKSSEGGWRYAEIVRGCRLRLISGLVS
ncbi:hypothetical protein BCR33DRAFT_718780 [Rhizoclosmatium globosum]|uniref:Uncharacterized protein n=1 Tax=Rhizoclosmatium globosum TaxID=329046 RepID=A0A1Y2C3K0_9FUNG|nr:hypothetical protein BCR33DRAFT_718780 [Rhizoclosmatium globosum]|eukprot:ORY41623.1 hypothetical protein BCR33DRAFT_718780 [Rhizoclosmatium globosum]